MEIQSILELITAETFSMIVSILLIFRIDNTLKELSHEIRNLITELSVK